LEDYIPAVSKTPLVKQQIDPLKLEKLLDEFC